MLRVSSNKKSVVVDPTSDEIEIFIGRAANKRLVTTEINRIVHVFNLLNLPALQKSLSDYTGANILSLRLRYKKLITTIKVAREQRCLPQFSLFDAYDRCAMELKHLRQSSELLVSKILSNPKAYLRLDAVCMEYPVSSYSFSVLQSQKEKNLLIKIHEQIAHRQKINPALISFSETVSWMHDQVGLIKLSSLTLLIIMNIKTCFHKLAEEYSQCPDYTSRSAIVAEMEPLALFLASLEQGIRRYPTFYTRSKDEQVVPRMGQGQDRSALILRFSSGS